VTGEMRNRRKHDQGWDIWLVGSEFLNALVAVIRN
jgi:hypothetical protein